MKTSVIIPTLNEEETISETLDDLLNHHSPDEVIVVDGGSSDQTLQLVGDRARIVQGPRGRAVQMNTGAKVASGDIFVFLHADTKLPEGGLQCIVSTLSSTHDAGRFRLKFDDNRFSLRFFASYTRFHCFSYGDQVFFMKKALFEDLSGYREDVPFEDVDFYKRLTQITKPIILKNHVITSARRFLKVGCMRQKFINLFLVGLYFAGFNVDGFKKSLYADVR